MTLSLGAVPVTEQRRALPETPRPCTGQSQQSAHAIRSHAAKSGFCDPGSWLVSPPPGVTITWVCDAVGPAIAADSSVGALDCRRGCTAEPDTPVPGYSPACTTRSPAGRHGFPSPRVLRPPAQACWRHPGEPSPIGRLMTRRCEPGCGSRPIRWRRATGEFSAALMSSSSTAELSKAHWAARVSNPATSERAA